MLKSERLSTIELTERWCQEHNPKGLPSEEESLTDYLNSKPGTWRLVSHSATHHVGDNRIFHYFIWSTGA